MLPPAGCRGTGQSRRHLRALRWLTTEMTALLQGAALCVDATHPYAVDATKNIRAACAVAGVEYHRLLREESPLPAGSMVFATAAHAAAFLAGCSGQCAAGYRRGKSLPPLRRSARSGCSPGCCPRGRALPPARPPVFRIRTSLPCRGLSAMR